MKIEDVDKNYQQQKSVSKSDTDFYKVPGEQFTVLGACTLQSGDRFAARIPEKIAQNISPAMSWLNHCGPGVRVCFETNSPYITVEAFSPGFGRTLADTIYNSAGISVMTSQNDRPFVYSGCVCPTYGEIRNDMEGKVKPFIGSIELCNATDQHNTSSCHKVILFMPALTDIKDLKVGVKCGSFINAVNPYRYKKPVVFYGSSITMGCCASRVNNNYPAMISHMLNTDFINLGFSGNAKGEPEIAEYIASIDMSVFVLDYDHNAPTVEHLKNTHEKFFKIIREKNPTLPIIMLSRPIFKGNDDVLRADIIMQTFLNAKRSGDNNVWYINGANLFDSYEKEFCSTDGTHPNDLGYFKMATAVSSIIKLLLKD